MKKVYLLIILVCTVLPLSAQKHYVPHVHVGFHGGMAMSKMSFSPSVEQKMLNGLTAGVSFRFAEERHVGLLTELNLTTRGWQEDLTGTALNYSRKLTYLELPIMTHIFFGGRKFKGFFNLGPQLCYMIGSSIDSNFDYKDPTNAEGFPLDYRSTEQMGMDIKNKFDYGIVVGAGIEGIIRKRHSLMLEARLYYGLGNIFPSSKKDTFSASRGMSIGITLGYMFRVK